MKANKKTMLGVALAVAVIALAGIGYATYQGTTSNSGNQITTEYVNIDLDRSTGDATLNDTTIWGGQTLAVKFDSVNTNGTIAYTLNSESIGKKLVIDVTVGGNNTTQTYDLIITVPTVQAAGVTGNWTYKIGTSEPVSANAGVITIEDATIANLSGQLILTLASNNASGTPGNTITIDQISFRVVSTS